jgi:hypothetical protein
MILEKEVYYSKYCRLEYRKYIFENLRLIMKRLETLVITQYTSF